MARRHKRLDTATCPYCKGGCVTIRGVISTHYNKARTLICQRGPGRLLNDARLDRAQTLRRELAEARVIPWSKVFGV